MALKLAVVTAGAVGGYFGGRLLEAGTGVEVRFMARGAHLQALQESGLKVKSIAGDFEVSPSQYFVSADAAEVVGGADLIFFAVKSQDTETVAQAMLPGLGEQAVVICLQNGVDNEEKLSALFGPERVAAGSAYIEAALDGPGAVKHTRIGRLAIAGKTEAGQAVPKLDELVKAFEKANVPCAVSEDGLTMKWDKLIFISAFSGWTAATRSRINKVLAEPELREAYRATLLETATVAQAAGAKINPEEAAAQKLGFSANQGDMTSSMLFDLEQGKPLEVEALNGTVVRKGRELGVPTPYNQALLALLSLHNKK